MFLAFASAFVIAAPEAVHAQAFDPQLCSENSCPTVDPFNWQPNTDSIVLTPVGGRLDDTINGLRIIFSPLSVFANTTIQYAAVGSNGAQVGDTVLPERGEILGLFTLEMAQRRPFDAAATGDVLKTVESVQPGDASLQDPDQSALFLPWTLRLNYAGCATPVGCEFAMYDEASLRCYWYNPTADDWEATSRSIDLDDNRLTCSSRETGLFAIGARRAETSGEVESAPIYLPIIMR